MMMRGKRGKVQSVHSCEVGIGRGGAVVTTRGIVRSTDEARRLGVLPLYVMAQQLIAQRDLSMEA